LAVKIRLARAGAKKAPFYRIVAADSRSPRDGRFLEILGRYNPRTEPSFIDLDIERTEAWVAKGAQMTETVEKLYKIAKSPEAHAPVKDEKLSKKAQAKALAESEAAAKAAEEQAQVPDAAATEGEASDAPSAADAKSE